jgi:hypothetical protein
MHQEMPFQGGILRKAAVHGSLKKPGLMLSVGGASGGDEKDEAE